MKSKYILLLSFVHAFCFSQTNKIIYSLEINIDKEKTINQSRIDYYNQLNKIYKTINFTLEYNDTISKFSIPERMDVENNEISNAILYSGVEKPIYCFNGKTYTFGEGDFFKEKEYLVKSETAKNWIIHNDTLNVNGFKCYKATSNYSNNSENTFTDIAWFCPSIPGNFGPYGVGNLPGTILIYQHANNIFKAKKIISNTSERIDVQLPSKIITEKEHTELWKKWEKEEFGTD